jgi:hypothetical protein
MKKQILLGFLSIFLCFSLNHVVGSSIMQKKNNRIDEVRRLSHLLKLYYQNKKDCKKDPRNRPLMTIIDTEKERNINTTLLEEIKNDFSQCLSENKMHCLGFFGDIDKGNESLYKYIDIKFDPRPKQNDITKVLAVTIFIEEEKIDNNNQQIHCQLITPEFLKLSYKNINFAKTPIIKGYIKLFSKGFTDDKFSLSMNDLQGLVNFFHFIPNNLMKEKGKQYILDFFDANSGNLHYIGALTRFGIRYKFFLMALNQEYDALIVFNTKYNSKHAILFKKEDGKHALFIPYINQSIVN